jgi:hypothetical protein
MRALLTFRKSGGLDSEMGNKIGDKCPADKAMGILPRIVKTFTKRTEGEENHDDDTDGE